MSYSAKVITGSLIPQIRDLALQGQSDTVWFEGRSDKYIYDAGEDIYWQTLGRYLLIYIESLGENSYSYRLYRCLGEAWYDRRTVLNPALESEDYRCLFSFRETKDNKQLIYLHDDGIWYEDYERAVSDMFNE